MTSNEEEYTDRPAGPTLPDAPEPEFEYGPLESYDDKEPNPFRRLGYLDRQFGQSSMTMLILLALVVSYMALPFALVGVVACRDPRARRKAWIVLAISLGPAAAILALIASNQR